MSGCVGPDGDDLALTGALRRPLRADRQRESLQARFGLVTAARGPQTVHLRREPADLIGELEEGTLRDGVGPIEVEVAVANDTHAKLVDLLVLRRESRTDV